MAQVTLCGWLSSGSGIIGLLTMLHPLPGFCPIRLWGTPLGGTKWSQPTTQQSLVETQATPCRKSEPVVFALLTMLQPVPLYCSMSVWLLLSPTAQHSLVDAQ